MYYQKPFLIHCVILILLLFGYNDLQLHIDNEVIYIFSVYFLRRTGCAYDRETYSFITSFKYNCDVIVN